MRVVDALEVVQVEHQQADRRLCASRVGKFRFRVAEERTTREDPGQMVEFDGKEELTLGSTAFLGRTGNRYRPQRDQCDRYGCDDVLVPRRGGLISDVESTATRHHE